MILRAFGRAKVSRRRLESFGAVDNQLRDLRRRIYELHDSLKMKRKEGTLSSGLLRERSS